MPRKPKRHELQNRTFRVKHGLERVSIPRIELPERHLFVSEGTKTEPNYLRGLVTMISQHYGTQAKKQFHIIGEGDNTLNLLQRAEAYQQNEAYDYQHVWIIYDKDDFPADDFDNTVHRCDAINQRFQSEGRSTKFHAIWSNQCIELWFLLHFCYLQADIDQNQYRKVLSEKMGRHYEKNDDSIFATLYPHMEQAIKNAKHLMKNHSTEIPPSQKVPATNFYELAEYLRGYM